MTSHLIHDQAKKQMQKRPELAPGYTVRVHERIKEGEKERTQIFEGLIISIHKGHSPTDVTFTVRKIASGVGVERIFLLHSPVLDKIEVKKVAKVRRAKLSFLRGRSGKSARMSERFTSSDEFGIAVAAPVKEEEEAAADEMAPVQEKKEEAKA